MICPACENELIEIEAGEIQVDVCQGGCAGIWFDVFELKKSERFHESARNLLVNLSRREDLEVDPKVRRNCPRCPEIVMMRRYFSRRRQVEIDECPNCGGVWLDAGEWERILQETRKDAAQAVLSRERDEIVRLVYRYFSEEEVRW